MNGSFSRLPGKSLGWRNLRTPASPHILGGQNLLRIVEYLVRNIYLFHIWYTSMYCRDEGIMVKKCGRCSSDNTDDSKYCLRCGTLLSAAPLTKPIVVEPCYDPSHSHHPAVMVRSISFTSLATKPISSIMAQPQSVRSITPIGMCFYHHDLPAIHVCARCGRQICRTCSMSRSVLMLCPECSHRISP